MMVEQASPQYQSRVFPLYSQESVKDYFYEGMAPLQPQLIKLPLKAMKAKNSFKEFPSILAFEHFLV